MTKSLTRNFFITAFLLYTLTNLTYSEELNDFHKRLRNDSDALKYGSTDYGNLFHDIPSAVLYPSSVKDIVDLIRSSIPGPNTFTIAAKGHGHSAQGQGMARGGVVVDMKSLGKSDESVKISIFCDDKAGYYADVGGHELWIDVLHETIKHGVAPVSWTDYLYLSVGGTLSNAGISGQTFLYGPQISNVLELDVVTGKGDIITCSKHKNHELFFAVLGGLGQFGIITRARIVLQKAPTRTKWARVIYTSFDDFSKDQERLISTNVFDYVEGFIFTDEIGITSWRSAFNTSSDQSNIISLLHKQGLLYCIELAKYYDDESAGTIDQEFQKLLKELSSDVHEYGFEADVTYSAFLERVGNVDKLTKPVMTHPWLHLLIPKSRIFDFNTNVVVGMLSKLNQTGSVSLYYPFNKNKWDDRMSAVVTDEEIVYMLGLLHRGTPSEAKKYEQLNKRILDYCKKDGINVKQYLSFYESKEEWIEQFGKKWSTFKERKKQFDPKMILSPGQHIFN